MTDEDRPRTHRWYKNQRPSAREPEPARLRVRVPEGEVADHEQVAEATREALAHWPIVVIKLVGTASESIRVGRHPGRWLRKHIGHSIDASLCSCQGPRAYSPTAKRIGSSAGTQSAASPTEKPGPLW